MERICVELSSDDIWVGGKISLHFMNEICIFTTDKPFQTEEKCMCEFIMYVSYLVDYAS